jgi:hypothetical protein
VFFELDGKGCGLGYFLDDLDLRDADLVAAGSALLGANFAGDDDAGFLGEALEGVKGVGRLFQRADTLDHAGSVAKDGKKELAGFAKIVEPALDGDFLAVVLACLFDDDDGHRRFLEYSETDSLSE